MAYVISAARIAAFRLQRHQLTGNSRAGAVEICRQIGGVQAQVLAAAQMALWARNRHLTRTTLDGALYEARTLVKTSCMRQTLHLIPADEFTLYIEALKESRRRMLRRVMAKFGITPGAIERLNAVVLARLATGPHTQRELAAHIVPRVGAPVRRWMAQVWNTLRPALVEGLICYGPPRGQEVTFVRVDQWLPAQPRPSADQAQRFLLRRYLQAYGPATPRDFAAWSGLSMAESRSRISQEQELAGELQEVETDSGRAFLLRADLEPLRRGPPDLPAVLLLPRFDPFLLGHADKSCLVDAADYGKVYRKAGWISPVLLLEGRVAGIWSHTRRGTRLQVTITPFRPFPAKNRRLVVQQAGRLGEFFGCRAEITFAD